MNVQNLNLKLIAILISISMLLFLLDFSILEIIQMIVFVIISKGYLRFIDSFLKDYESHIVSRAVIYNLFYFLIVSIFAYLFLV